MKTVLLAQEQTLRSMEQNRKLRNDPQLYGQLIFNKAGKNNKWEKNLLNQ